MLEAATFAPQAVGLTGGGVMHSRRPTDVFKYTHTCVCWHYIYIELAIYCCILVIASVGLVEWVVVVGQ